MLSPAYPDLHILQLAEKGVDPNDDYLVLVDYTLSSKAKRLWVFDDNRKIIFNTQCAHGSGSGNDGHLMFSNVPNSKQSSIGFMRVGELYDGKHGPSLRLIGLETEFNDKVLKREVVIHTAEYANNGGRSWGCLALPPNPGAEIIKLLAGKRVTVFAYYSDPWYLSHSKVLNHD